MSILLDGTNGIIVSGNTNTFAGVYVGEGAGAIATNTAIGVSALAANTTGQTNTALGASALAVNTSGSSNTAVGRDALQGSSTSSLHTAIGTSALYSNTSGGSNTAVGATSLYANTTGSFNVAMGVQALRYSETASNNTAVGYQAGYNNSTGIENVFLGSQAGYSSTTASGSVYLGYYSGQATTGLGNTFIGNGSGYLVTSGTKNTILGKYNGNQGGLDIRTANNYIVLSDGNGNPRIWHDDGGTIYVPSAYNATTASAANGFIRSDGAFLRSTSALKYKQDIRDLESMDIGLLRPVRYKSKCEGDDQTKDHLGIVADEAADAGFEELVTRGATGEVEGFQYERLTVVLLKAIQELKAEFDAYKASHP